MKVTMLLCDFAQAAEGKLYVIGGGWSIKGENSPMGVALKIEVPWDQANRPHELVLKLLDEDGEPTTLQTPVGEQAIEVHHKFEVGRPPGLPEGTPLDLPVAINLAPLPLEPGHRFEWRLEIDGEGRRDWHLSFMTRPTPS